MTAKIPQNVTREDRIVGPLTIKQFLYVLAGSSIVFIAYQYYSRQFLFFTEFVVISFIAATLTLALAFAKVNGQPFGVFLINLAKFITIPKNRIWYKQPRDALDTIKVKATDIKDTTDEIKERQSGQDFKMQIEKLASILDTGGTINPNDRDAITDQISNLPTSEAQLTDADFSVEDIFREVD